LGVMVRVDVRELDLKDASRILGISYRHTKRVRKRYREEGDVGLVHRDRGRGSNRGFGDDVWAYVFGLYWGRYVGFGPTLFSEKLEEDHGVRIDHFITSPDMSVHLATTVRQYCIASAKDKKDCGWNCLLCY